MLLAWVPPGVRLNPWKLDHTDLEWNTSTSCHQQHHQKQHQSSWELPELRASDTIQYFVHTAHETLPSRLQLLPSNAIIISVVLVRKLRLSLCQSYKKNQLAQKLWFNAGLLIQSPMQPLSMQEPWRCWLGLPWLCFLESLKSLVKLTQTHKIEQLKCSTMGQQWGKENRSRRLKSNGNSPCWVKLWLYLSCPW